MSTPSFTFESARKVFEDLAPKPPPEPPRITAARQLLERTPEASRDYVGAEIIRRADGPDEAMQLHALVTEQLAADAAQADEDLARTITDALKPAEPASPYLDDNQQLRDPAGNPVDVMGTDWHTKPWYREAAGLLRDAGYEHEAARDETGTAG